MRRVLAPALLLLLAGSTLSAQTSEPPGTVLRLGVGATRMDFTCGDCQIDAQTGISGFIAASRPIGRGFTAGLEATLANAAFNVGLSSEDPRLALGSDGGGGAARQTGAAGLGDARARMDVVQRHRTELERTRALAARRGRPGGRSPGVRESLRGIRDHAGTRRTRGRHDLRSFRASTVRTESSVQLSAGDRVDAEAVIALRPRRQPETPPTPPA